MTKILEIKPILETETRTVKSRNDKGTSTELGLWIPEIHQSMENIIKSRKRSFRSRYVFRSQNTHDERRDGRGPDFINSGSVNESSRNSQCLTRN